MNAQLRPGDPVSVNMPTGAAYRIDNLEIQEVEPRAGLVLGIAVLVGSDVHILNPHEINRL